MEFGKRDRFINKIVNSFVLIIIGESLSLYYIFASRTRVPILVRATILVTILQWPIILFARPGLFYSTCPTITVYLTMTDLLHCRSITIFISPYPPLPGIMKTKTRLLLLCRLNFIQRCFVDSTFLFTIRFDSIGGIGVGEKSPPSSRSRVKGRRNFARSKHVLDPLQEEEG